MIRYHLQGTIEEDPTGDYVAWTDVQSMNEELQAFASSLIEMVADGQITKDKTANALAACIRISI